MLTCTDFFAIGKYWKIKEITARNVYEICIEKKFCQPYTQKKWENVLDLKLTKQDWIQLYKTNVSDLKYRKFAEFKLKVLHDILPSRKKICKWQEDISPNCEYCNQPEDTVHMLFQCPRVLDVWKCVSKCLELNIKLKHIILGLNGEFILNISRHLCIVIISYAIYATWCKCSFEKTNYAHVNLKCEIKQQLHFYLNIFGHIFKSKLKEHFTQIVNSTLKHL